MHWVIQESFLLFLLLTCHCLLFFPDVSLLTSSLSKNTTTLTLNRSTTELYFFLLNDLSSLVFHHLAERPSEVSASFWNLYFFIMLPHSKREYACFCFSSTVSLYFCLIWSNLAWWNINVFRTAPDVALCKRRFVFVRGVSATVSAGCFLIARCHRFLNFRARCWFLCASILAWFNW